MSLLTDNATLSGPDGPVVQPGPKAGPQSTAPLPVAYTDALSSPTDKIPTTAKTPPPPTAPISSTTADALSGSDAARSTGAGAGIHGGGAAPPPVIPLPVVIGPPGTHASPYTFYGSMSEEQLHMYLDKAIDMNGLSLYTWTDDLIESAPPLEYATLADHNDDIRMILNIGAKFIGGMMEFESAFDRLMTGLDQFKTDVDTLHATDPDIICEARLDEAIDSTAVYVNVPGYVFDAFGQPHVLRTFQPTLMFYDSPADACSYAVDIPAIDITKTESQMWIYFIATTAIEYGAEAVIFPNAIIINCQDDGNAKVWYVANLVRDYARNPPSGPPSAPYGLIGARRKMVLVGGDAIPIPNGLGGYGTKETMYFDPAPAAPLPEWQRQLIWDYNLAAIQSFCKPTSILPCTPDFLPVILDPTSQNWLTLIQGGKHPLGWYCAHMPCVIENDNDAPYFDSGCNYYCNNQSAVTWRPFWGYDASSWYPAQSPWFRNIMAQYFYYRAKCINPYAHYNLPGRLFAKQYLDGSTTYAQQVMYRANAPLPYGGQEDTFKAIFQGLIPIRIDWVFHNFINENLADDTDILPASGLVLVGDDKMYCIGTDGYIHGFIKVNGDYNDGTWLTTSPSYAADVPVANQVRARSDLVTSPDGTRLLYIGYDGFIYGFDIITPWSYSYIVINATSHGSFIVNGFLRDAMIAQQINAVCCLIYPTNDSIYYIGRYLGSGPDHNTVHVHGFQKSPGENWQTVSPSYAAAETLVAGQLISEQVQVAGALTYDAYSSPGRIFYRGIDGLLYYFVVHDLITYTYVPCPRNTYLSSHGMKILGNLAIYQNMIYYVCLYIDGSNFIDCIIDDGSATWDGVSPSFSAAEFFGQSLGSQAQSDSNGYIAVSPDGNTIAYLGTAGTPVESYVYYFQNIAGEYQYKNMGLENQNLGNSLQFMSSTDFYFIAINSAGYIAHFKFQQAFCPCF